MQNCDHLCKTQVTLKTPKKSGDKRSGEANTAPFSIFVPDEVKVIREVVFNPFYEKTVEQKHWRTAATHWDFALVGANLFGVRNADLREVVTDGLNAMAEASGHAEITNSPMCLVGMSAGGGMSVNIAEAMPERVIAVAPVCLEVGPKSEATRKIPIITIFGERDGKQMEKLSAKLPEQRALGAQWAIAVQWGRRHEFAKANNLIMPFFDTVIAERYPAGVSPVEGVVDLKPYPEEAVWLGDKDGWEDYAAGIGPWRLRGTKRQKGHPPGDSSRGCWLPNEEFARLWRGFVVREPKIKFVSPPGLGDGQPFLVHDAGKQIVVKVSVAKGVNLRTLSAPGGSLKDVEGGREYEFLWTPEKAGIFAREAEGWDREGPRHCAMPHTILVR